MSIVHNIKLDIFFIFFFFFVAVSELCGTFCNLRLGNTVTEGVTPSPLKKSYGNVPKFHLRQPVFVNETYIKHWDLQFIFDTYFYNYHIADI